MLRRTLVWTTLIIAGLCVLLAALLTRPPEVYEMLVGFAIGTLGRAQWGLIAITVVLLLAGALIDSNATPARRLTRFALGAVAAIVGVSAVARDQWSITRDTVAIPAADLTLEATTYRPRERTTGRRPAILMLHGSGPVRRDAYHMYARRFVAKGFIVLNVDKRGVGGSEGTYFGDDLAKPVIELRAADARLALDYLAAQPDVDPARIGMFAVSQGGWIVPLLLDRRTPARFGISFSGAAGSSGEEGQWSDWAGEDNDHFGFNPPPIPFPKLDERMRQVSPRHFDPRAALARMKAPSLWLYGEWDSSAPTAASMRVLDSLRANDIPVTARVFAEANHGLFIVRGPRGTRHANVAPGVWDSVFAWTERQGVTSSSDHD